MKNVVRNIQLRLDIPEGDISGFGIGGFSLIIEGRSNKRDLIPSNASPFWQNVQYKAHDMAGNRYEVYVYYYMDFSLGVRYAVVDAYRPE